MDHIVYQDNKSTIPLAENSKVSSIKSVKHIKSKYLFVTDRFGANELTVEY